MKIEKRFAVAEKLLKEITKGLANAEGFASVFTYHNGRENGFRIKVYSTKLFINADRIVIFSEYRTSDEIVVYHDLEPFEDEITDKAYKSKKFFAANAYDEAAKFCVKHLLSGGE